jgi:uncharacterized repeat protein (TIGR01451 family)
MKPLQELRQLPSRLQKHSRLAGLIIGGAIVLQAPAAFAVITPSAIFNPANTNQGTKAKFSLTLGNNSLTPVTGMTIANTPLPAGLVLSTTPVVSNTCGGTPVANPLATSFGLTGGNIPALAAGVDGECTIVLEVIAKSGGNQVVSIAANSIAGGGATNTQGSTATLAVNGLAKMGTTVTFGPTLIPLPGSSRMTIRFDNPNGVALTGAKFLSGLPAGLKIKGTTFATNTCGGALTPTGGPPPTGFSFTGGTIPAGGCEFSWEIEGDLPGGTSQSSFTYTFADGIVETDQFVSNNAGSSSLTVQQGLRVQQSLSRTSAGPDGVGEGGTLQIFTGETAKLTMKLSNAGGALTNLNLNQTLPGGLVIADNITASTCPGMVVTANPGDGTFNFAAGGMPGATATALTECEISVNVKAAAAGTYTNNIAINTISNAQASNNLNASAVTLNVTDITAGGGTGIGIGINFAGGMNGFYPANAISAGNEARMTIGIYNGTGIPLTGVGLGAGGLKLPAGVRLATTPNPATDCPGGTASVAGTDAILMTGANLDRRGYCTVTVSVVSDAAATYTASALAASIVSTENRTNDLATGQLQVLDAINFEQYFNPTEVAASAAGNKAKMRLRLTNAAAAASAGTKLRFQLAGGLKMVGGFLTNTCAGTATLTAGTDIFDLTGATIPGSGGAQGLADDGFCEIEYEVLATGPVSTITNVVPPNSLTNGAGQSNKTPIQASLNLVAVNIRVNQQTINVTPGDPNIGKPIITGGEPAELRVTLSNESGITVTNINYLNTLPANVLVYGVPAIDPGTCTGAVIAAAPEDTKYGVSGITLAPGASCTFVFKITSLTSDNRDLNIASKDVQSIQGGTNADPSVVTLTTRGNATVSKTFTPPTIAAGGTSKLTLKVVNANVTPITAVELADVFPAGMLVADIPAVTNTCGGTVAAGAGADRVTLLGGTMIPSSICTITLNVTALTAQAYANTIPPLALKTAEGRTNVREITAALNVTGTSIIRPGMSLVKRITEIDGTAITGLFNFTPAAGRDEDNAANWPGPIDPAAGISPYLKGAFQGSQVLAQQNSLKVGSTIEYTGYFLSTGNGPAKTAELCDYLPKNTEFVPASLSATLGSGAALTGQYLAPGAAFPASCKGTDNGSGAVVVNLGDVVNATGVGTPNTSYGAFKFKLKVK